MKIIKSLHQSLSLIKSYYKENHLKPYALDSRLFPNKQYSDFFLYCNNAFRNRFVAENSYALLLRKKINVIHRFDFFNKNGSYIDNYQFKDSNFYSNILLPKFESINHKYLSFTHKIILLNDNDYYPNIKEKISFQHRGYSIVYKFPHSLGSVVHGNFGGIDVSKGISTKARIRKQKFIYTPVYRFINSSKYDLFFNNPTSTNLSIKIIMNSNISYKNKIDSKIIPALGNSFLHLSDYTGTISFESCMPTCRALIITDPDGKSNNYDIFHS